MKNCHTQVRSNESDITILHRCESYSEKKKSCDEAELPGLHAGLSAIIPQTNVLPNDRIQPKGHQLSSHCIENIQVEEYTNLCYKTNEFSSRSQLLLKNHDHYCNYCNQELNSKSDDKSFIQHPSSHQPISLPKETRVIDSSIHFEASGSDEAFAFKSVASSDLGYLAKITEEGMSNGYYNDMFQICHCEIKLISMGYYIMKQPVGFDL